MSVRLPTDEMPTNQHLPAGPKAQLRAIIPSRDGTLAYYPCRAILDDGSVHDRIYFVDSNEFARIWGIVSERPTVDAGRVVQIEVATDRLPPDLANTLYEAGESGMGYCVFVVRFRDGAEQPYVTGNAVDFLDWPTGRSGADAVAVYPHHGRGMPHRAGLSFQWCPVANLAAAT